MSKVPFSVFNDAIQKQFAAMVASGAPLVSLDIDNDVIWNTYLDSFPEGTNPIFRERREYDCNCCKNFVRRLGNVVAITPNGYMSVWDVTVDGYYNDVAQAMAKFVKQHTIRDIYVTSEPVAGSKPNKDGATDVTWTHFYVQIPKEFVKKKDEIGPYLSNFRSSFQVFERAMEELTLDAFNTVLELINQDSIYRGTQFKKTVSDFRKLKEQYDNLDSGYGYQRIYFLWSKVKTLGDVVRFRNTAIGTLVTDLSEGVGLDRAVASFESKVAPQNYKRTTSLVTPRMIQQAQEQIEELGLTDSLYRRFATPQDVTVDNVLFTASNKKSLNIFDDLTAEAQSKVKAKTLDKVEEISIDKFIANVLPTATKVEVLVEGKHTPNFMSLIAPTSQSPVNMFQWNNPFSWAYTGDITDSIRETVKKFGGSLEGDLRVSLSWFNADDLDLSLTEPTGETITYGHRRSKSGGQLDLDMNGLDKHSETEPVENIVYKNRHQMAKGIYKVKVNQFSRRRTTDVGFILQVEYDGQIHNFRYDEMFTGSHEVMLEINFDGKNFEIVNTNNKLVGNATTSKEVWGLNTNTFVPVTMILNSPNHWNGEAVGNKHTFFILENCKTDEEARGFFNEFLRTDLVPHRKVFELLGSKTKAVPTDNQVSGLGFSETNRNEVVVRVTGQTLRTLKVKF